MTPEALADHFRSHLGEAVLASDTSYGQLTLTVAPEAFDTAARLCKEDDRLGFDFFDFLSGIDERDEGFAVIVQLYSTGWRHHVTLRTIAPGGRETPRVPSLTGVYRGANWHERETYDMFGVVFDGHPGLLPRILTVENFEGWPLRKEFHLSTRDVKPWPGAKEPGGGEEGEEAAAPAPAAAASPDDKKAAAKAKAERAKAKAAEARRRKAEAKAAELQSEDEEAAAGGSAADTAVTPDTDAPDEPIAAAAATDASIAGDAAAGQVQGDTAEPAPGEGEPGQTEPQPDPRAEREAAEGGEPTRGEAPGIEAKGRRKGARSAPDPKTRYQRKSDRDPGDVDEEDR